MQQVNAARILIVSDKHEWHLDCVDRQIIFAPSVCWNSNRTDCKPAKGSKAAARRTKTSKETCRLALQFLQSLGDASNYWQEKGNLCNRFVPFFSLAETRCCCCCCCCSCSWKQQAELL